MKQYRLAKILIAPALAAVALGLSTSVLRGQSAFAQTNLVSDIPGLAAHLDPNLVNPWGIASSGASPFWVSDAGPGVATLYNSLGVANAMVVTIVPPGGGPSVPTGQVFNTSTAFNGDLFLFATARGTIEGWRGALGTTAEILENNAASGASYLGIALGAPAASTLIYAANFAQNRIDVFSAPFTPASLPGTFTDAAMQPGYAPFNIQNINNNLFVTYALVGPDGDSLDGAGHGYVDEYDLNGNLVKRFASQGALNSPWGLALAPASFGSFGGDLLVGNFGDGTINAYDFNTGSFIGTLKDAQGNPIVNDGLWGLRFGNGGNGGATNTLYFAAGIDDEQHGLFGAIAPVPEPSTYGVAASLGLAGLCFLKRLRRRRGREIPHA